MHSKASVDAKKSIGSDAVLLVSRIKFNELSSREVLAPIVEKVDYAIHRIAQLVCLVKIENPAQGSYLMLI